MRAPTRLIRITLLLTLTAAMGATGKQHFGQRGLVIGIFLGVLLGWLAGWWVKRTFLDF